jgi:DNA-binding response OmpR family regulator
MKTLLVADDDFMILDLYKMKFSKVGYQVVLVSNPTEVVGRIKEVKPALVLLDRRFGEGDGLEILKQLRLLPEAKTLPVFLLSNQDPNAEELTTLKALGGCEYLVKEKIELNDLVAKVKQVVEP